MVGQANGLAQARNGFIKSLRSVRGPRLSLSTIHASGAEAMITNDEKNATVKPLRAKWPPQNIL